MFITKIYVCVEFQLLLLFGFLFFSRKYDLDYFFVSDLGQVLFGMSLFLLIWCLFASCCWSDIYKSFPINYILLMLFSACMSYIFSYCTYSLDNDIVFSGAIITTFDVLLIILMSLWVDLPDMISFLLISTYSLLLLCIINYFIANVVLQTVITFSGSILFSGFLLYDTNQITNINSRMYSKDDYILASISIYLDILNIFIYILQCLQLTDTSN